jgi:hypothetical protein
MLRGMLQGVGWYVVADVLGSFLKGQAVRESRSNCTYSFMYVPGLLSHCNDQVTFWSAGDCDSILGEDKDV